MYTKDGMVYADDPTPIMEICGLKVLPDYKLWLRFSTGESKICDIKPYLDYPAFQALKDKRVFESAYIDYGVVTWLDGRVDIAPESLYEKGVLASTPMAKTA